MSHEREGIDEECGCGAKFTWRGIGYGRTEALTAADLWRANHRHIEPGAVGICGEANRVEGAVPSTLICDLPAGHAGWHQEGSRGRWGFPRWPMRATES